MNNNNKNEQIHKLEREIWLFEQWLQSIDGQVGETQARIRHAYKECITSRKLELAKLQSHQAESTVLQAKPSNQHKI
ncbi:MAG: peptidoglycan hydrolase CwlO-like protein [Oceanicoccus sp.]|jgi:peptidoglycan hydrolase CwlO-like protein